MSETDVTLTNSIERLINTHRSKEHIKKNTKVGLSFCPPTSVKKIIEKLNKKKINFLILDKSYIKNKKIQNLEITKYYYTIRTKSEFNKFKKNNNLIFENL